MIIKKEGIRIIECRVFFLSFAASECLALSFVYVEITKKCAVGARSNERDA